MSWQAARDQLFCVGVIAIGEMSQAQYDKS
jgi:hypothetical protein